MKQMAVKNEDKKVYLDRVRQNRSKSALEVQQQSQQSHEKKVQEEAKLVDLANESITVKARRKSSVMPAKASDTDTGDLVKIPTIYEPEFNESSEESLNFTASNKYLHRISFSQDTSRFCSTEFGRRRSSSIIRSSWSQELHVSMDQIADSPRESTPVQLPPNSEFQVLTMNGMIELEDLPVKVPQVKSNQMWKKLH